ncbi:Phosphonoacetaldehyde hydrolase [Fimbriiglobus ruber]|uniref:phosphonoacetaldehyde hydrolase n=2 Tax=Fimbriiglobus ruber TaxID=1908690 RepID=A0A225DRJ9_9BACT|nr:Phosphonoacetaldehyde hydrolase [Fimbriiglobus ruber]
MVVFDWAGTTVDFGSVAPAGAFVEAFARKGVTVTSDEARAPMGVHKKAHIEAMLKSESVGAKWREAAGRDWTRDDIDALYQLVTPMQVEAARKHGRLVPGVRECVAALRARGIKVAATTGYFAAAAAAVYEVAAAQGYVPDFTICADEVPAGRPAPWMIFRAMERLCVYPPAAVVKVGDTIVDIEDGRNAGVWSVGVIDSSNEMGLSEEEFNALSAEERDSRRAAVHERYEAARANDIINNLNELLPLIDDINERLRACSRP